MNYIYCDESCHLPNDSSEVMVLGAISCPHDKKKEIFNKIRSIKSRHNVGKSEIKWTKISAPKFDLYKELLDYFFEEKDLRFRAIVATNKSELDHDQFNDGDPNLWYYKMYYFLLSRFCLPNEEYRIFIDVKDTNGGPRVRKLREVLCNNKFDFKRETIKDISQVDSRSSDLLQITDLLIGALGYYHRGLYQKSKTTKTEFVNSLIDFIGGKINGTYPDEYKFNVFIWHPRRGN
ncbi:DUF3800 domain-containing protein [Sporolactobacillus terrae]|uniref:DUF3800 domain-containing protein n=1 Tax=Sporolactobacillus terrae TaxID=269673 RepID=UPI00048D2A6C|nr:DUF3800 domain-containing protein [Sporolactobacillus terrae]